MIPFMRDPKKPPLHLRQWTVAEVELHRKMIRKQERLREIQKQLAPDRRG